jgi:hypothetical protein
MPDGSYRFDEAEILVWLENRKVTQLRASSPTLDDDNLSFRHIGKQMAAGPPPRQVRPKL